MDYVLFDEDKQHEALANTLLAQEMDHYIHSVNLARYKQMLVSLPHGEFRDRIQLDHHDETVKRLSEVQSILDALRLQLPSAEKLKAALTRIEARQKTRRE